MKEDDSQTHRAYMEIRAALISCRLAPGSRLNIVRLQREIGASQAAVREALSRLTAEGFVVIERNSGFRAAPISMDGYRELADAVLALEEILLRAWSQLYAQQLRYRQVFADLARFERGLHADYRDYLEAVIDRDVERALRLWRANHDKIVKFIEGQLAVAPASVPVGQDV